MVPPIPLAITSTNNNNKIRAKVRTADKIVLSVREEINIPNDNIAAASKIKPKFPSKVIVGDMGGLDALMAIACKMNKGTIRVVKNVSTPNNLPTATAQLVTGEVANSSKVPSLRSSAYNPIENIGKINNSSHPNLSRNARINS